MINQQTLRLVTREIRVTANPPAWSPVINARAFARSILTRFGRRWERPPTLSMHWLNPHYPFMCVQSAYHQSHINFAPRLSLIIAGSPSHDKAAESSVSAGSRPATAALPGQALIFRDQSTVPQDEKTVFQIRQIQVTREQLLHRLVTQRRRIESIQQTDDTARMIWTANDARGVEHVPQTRRSATVVRRPKDVTNVERESTRSGATSGCNFTDTQSADPATQPQARPVHPHIDIKHVTDQVLQNIDQRIIAQRERMGRI